MNVQVWALGRMKDWFWSTLAFKPFCLIDRAQERSSPQVHRSRRVNQDLQGGLGTKQLFSCTLIHHLCISVSGTLRTELRYSLVYWLKHYHRHLQASNPLFTTLRIILNHFSPEFISSLFQGLGLTQRPQSRKICPKQTIPSAALKSNKGPI